MVSARLKAKRSGGNLGASSHIFMFWKPLRAAEKSETRLAAPLRAFACRCLAACTAEESPRGSWDCICTKGDAWLGPEPFISDCSASISSALPMMFGLLESACSSFSSSASSPASGPDLEPGFSF